MRVVKILIDMSYICALMRTAKLLLEIVRIILYVLVFRKSDVQSSCNFFVIFSQVPFIVLLFFIKNVKIIRSLKLKT